MTPTELRATMLQAILAQGVPLEQAMIDAEAAVSYVLSGAQAEPQRPVKRRDQVLDMWASGLAVWQIAADVGGTLPSVRQIIHRARVAGDPRALRRRRLTEEQIAAAADRMRATRARMMQERAP